MSEFPTFSEAPHWEFGALGNAVDVLTWRGPALWGERTCYSDRKTSEYDERRRLRDYDHAHMTVTVTRLLGGSAHHPSALSR